METVIYDNGKSRLVATKDDDVIRLTQEINIGSEKVTNEIFLYIDELQSVLSFVHENEN